MTRKSVSIDEVRLAAQMLVEQYGDRALDQVRKINEITVSPGFLRAVAREVQRLLQDKKQ